MTPKKICLVTDELFPFTAGGIGRILHNLIRDSLERSPDVRFHVLVPGGCKVKAERLREHFGERVSGGTVFFREGGEPIEEGGFVYPGADAFRQTTRCQAQSLDFMLVLKRMEREGITFDAIEFPDFRGWAFCTLQEKRLGLAFQKTEIAVRLHSTDGLIQKFEARLPDWEQLGRYELERKALLDADRVVAHLPQIGPYNQQHYGFPESWREKLTVEFPPVLWKEASQFVPRRSQPDILFITKIQEIKQPELFVRGCAELMRRCPKFGGKAVLACHAFEEGYLKAIQALIPSDLQARFEFSGPNANRREQVAGQIVVIPSAFESLNLAAYEASAAGAKLVLNEKCLAFSEGAPFVDGKSCVKFDGTAAGLSTALQRALFGPDLRPVDTRVDSPYWLGTLAASAVTAARSPKVTVVVVNRNFGAYLPEAIESVAASTYPEVELLVVDEASTGPLDGPVLERLEVASADLPVKVIRNPVPEGTGAAMNSGLEAADGEYVCFLQGCDRLAPEFLERAIHGLERWPEFSLVVPTEDGFSLESELEGAQRVPVGVYLGDAPMLGLQLNRLGGANFLVRRELARKLKFSETLPHCQEWDFCLRAAHTGARFLVTNAIQAHRRAVRIPNLSPEARRKLAFCIHERLPTPLPSSVRPFGFLVQWQPGLCIALPPGFQSAAEPQELAGADEIPLRYRIADGLNAAVEPLPVYPMIERSASLALKLALSTQRLLLNQEDLKGWMSGGNQLDLAGEHAPVRYQIADTINYTVKRLPILHPLLKRSAAAATKVVRSLRVP